MEGTLHYAHKESKRRRPIPASRPWCSASTAPAAASPPVTTLLRRLVNLREGKTPGPPLRKKPMVVSMASLTASGGYYIAMAAEKLFAERTTITGSIGVYAAFPNVSELAN